jgi:DNA (cytosine-5)-methyltransferase 1
MVRQNGYEPKFGNLIPEFERCIVEAEPDWFVMEEVPDAPVPAVKGYGVHSFLLNNRQLGEKQNRVRRWSFGLRGRRRILEVETQVFEHPEFEYAACGGGNCWPDGKGGMPWNHKGQKGFDMVRRAQGLPDNFDLPPFTVAAKCQAIGNGVPMAMGRAIAKAVKRAVDV